MKKRLLYFLRLRFSVPFIIFILLLGKFIFKPSKEIDVNKKIIKDSTTEERWSYTFQKGDVLYDILLWKAKIQPSYAILISEKFKTLWNPKKMMVGDRVNIAFEGDKPIRVVLAPKKYPLFRLVLSRNGSLEFSGDTLILPHRKEIVLFKTQIKDNLFFALDTLPDGQNLSARVVDIFAWDIDFATEIQQGDSLAMLLERVFINDSFRFYGDIIYVHFKGLFFGDVQAYLFEGNYYDEDGKSLRKGFLRSPLSYGWVTSRFSHRRFHPILRTWRPHHGVDYGAPSGTPVKSIADGYVIYAGWKGGYGNIVHIKHVNGYVTGYGHLKKIKAGIRRGRRVQMGDIIGYVGNTGLSTGSHLHFEIKKNGKFLNFLRIKFPPYRVLKGEKLAVFQKTVEEIKNIINNLEKKDDLT